MPKPTSHSALLQRFVPSSIEDVFAIYLSRELDDIRRVRWYAGITRQYSMCVLLNALRRARRHRTDKVGPEQFIEALRALLEEKPLV
jgi:hypothetical protein